MQAIGHGLRFAWAVSAAAKAESAAGGTVAARRRGILDDGIWRGARASRREHGTALTQGRETHPTPKRSLPPAHIRRQCPHGKLGGTDRNCQQQLNCLLYPNERHRMRPKGVAERESQANLNISKTPDAPCNLEHAPIAYALSMLFVNQLSACKKRTSKSKTRTPGNSATKTSKFVNRGNRSGSSSATKAMTPTLC